MKLLLLTPLLLWSLNSFAAVSDGKYMEIEIEKMDYDKPSGGRGSAGELNFKSVNVNWDGMQVNVKNTDKVFDTTIFYKKNYLGFLSPRLRMGFDLDKESGFHAIKNLDILKSTFIINPEFFSFNGEEFQFIDDKTLSRLKLKKFNLFCAGNTEFDLTTPDGIIAGCLTDFYVSGAEEKQLADAEIEYRDESGEVPFYLKSALDEIELREGKIKANIATAYISAPPFEINSKKIEATCSKDRDLITLDETEKLIKDCKNSISIKENLITIDNKEEHTFFDLVVDNLDVADEKLNINMSNAIINDPKTQTTLQQLSINCKKHVDADLLELHEVLANCFEDGRVKVSNIFSDEKKQKKKNMDISQFFEDGHLLKASGKSSKDIQSDLKNLDVSMRNNKMFVSADMKFIWNFTITVNANISHQPDQEKIILSVTKTKLPLGISWRKVLMFFLKRLLVVDFIEYQGNNIIITL